MTYGVNSNVLELFPNVIEEDFTNSHFEQNFSATFADNMTLPVHKWYRYTAGFSALWVRELIAREKINGRVNVIDPFAGSGTVMIECESQGVESRGIEAQPYIYKIASAKLAWSYPAEQFKAEALLFLENARNLKAESFTFPALIIKCYSEDTLKKLSLLKQAWLSTEQNSFMKDFTWFIITSILRITSSVGTAQWQYIQPNKTKSKVVDPFLAFKRKVLDIYSDMVYMQKTTTAYNPAVIYNEDARNIKSIAKGWGDLVITSPPYANNYDYADSTRLEMTFWGEISGWGDLQETVRKHLIRACTQHVSKLGLEIDEILSNPILAAIRDELTVVYDTLKIERLKHGGKKNYHFMIAAYFKDLAEVFISLRRTTSAGCLMCFVIGDSAPYGIYVPVERWLGDLALAAGFKNYTFEKLRDRNVKWKNRKHNVPLKEGRLWIEG